MNITINRPEMLAVSRRMAAVAPPESPLEVLRGTLLEADADGGKLTMTSTNMELSLVEKLACTASESGAFVVDARLLAGMLEKLPEETVELCRQSDSSPVTLKSGSASYTVPVWPRTSFPKPEIPFPEDTVKVRGIPNMAKHTTFAVSADNNKPLMRCVNLMFTPQGLQAAGSDGSCIVTAKGDQQSVGDINLLVPASSLVKLARMAENDDEFHVGTTGKSIVFFKDNFLFSARTMDGSYINTSQLLSAVENGFTVLTDMLERMEKSGVYNETLEQAIIEAANTAESKRRQAEAVGKKISADAARNQEEAAMLVARAVTTAAKKAQEVQSILASWSDEPGNMEKSALNRKMLDTVRQSDVLKRVSEYLGRFREIFAQGKRNSYAYGRGEKYSLELGRDLTRALSSELVMLASPETLPLFLRKYQRGQIKQYCRREPIFKGAGDIICCLDESSSTKGEPAAWGKAVALTLLEIAADGGRKFALVHFSGSDSIQTDLFLPGSYTAADKMAAAETFLGGGTNFQMPLDEALRLMEENGFENADVVFITDGECALSDEYAALLGAEQVSRRFTVTGVLLDKGKPAMDFSLKPFCQVIYRTSELVGDEIVQKLVDQRV